MFALKKLAELLRLMERGVRSAPQVAALPFNLPKWLDTAAQWSDLAAAFGESRTIAKGLLEDVDITPEQHDLLVRLLASDERKPLEATARTQGMTQHTRTDAVRDVLDWAAGAGDPRHSKAGRFWNLKHDDFVQVSVFGRNVTTRPSPNEEAPLVDKLRSGQMPRERPRLSEETEEFKVVESWVDDGCPE